MKKRINFDFTGKKAEKNLKAGFTIGAAAGTVFGAVAGILAAPKSGKETREILKGKVNETALKVAGGVNVTIKKVGEAASSSAKRILSKTKREAAPINEETEDKKEE